MNKIVDLSYYQGTIDFAKASKEIDLAIIRVQYGSSKVDSKYKEYVAGCKKYNIPFGHYAYARYISINDAVQEANDFTQRADPEAEFLVVDVEEMTLKKKSEIVAATQAFIDTCRRKNWKIGLYTGHAFYKKYSMEEVDADFLWIPRYLTDDKGLIHKVKPDMPCHLWQYTQTGKVAGIKGNVDLNVLNGDLTLDWFTGKVNKVKEAALPTPKPDKKVIYASLTASQWNEIATTYKKAYDEKVLSSDQWYKKAEKKMLTTDEISFVNAAIVGRKF